MNKYLIVKIIYFFLTDNIAARLMKCPIEKQKSQAFAPAFIGRTQLMGETLGDGDGKEKVFLENIIPRMKNTCLLLFLLSYFFSSGQTKIDTIKITGFLRGHIANEYFIDDIKVTKKRYDAWRPWPPMPSKKNFWLKVYDINKRLRKEGLANKIHHQLFCDTLREYYTNGNIKSIGQYRIINPQPNAILKNGEWKYFDESGKYIRSEFYKDGIEEK